MESQDLSRSRSLTQDELDGYFRFDFVQQVTDRLAKRGVVRFIVHGNFYSLIEIKRENGGEWTLHVADEHRYTHHFSGVVDLLEKLYDKKVEIIALKGELQIDCRHVTANPDARSRV